MYGVKQAATRRLMGELKDFAFEMNPGFHDGSQRGLDIEKSFFPRDHPSEQLARRLGADFCRLTFGFSAHRLSNTERSSYSYAGYTGLQRSIDSLPATILPQVRPKHMRKFHGFQDIRPGLLHEHISVSVSVADDEDDICIDDDYQLTYLGRTIYRNSAAEMIEDPSGEFVDVPAVESYMAGSTRMFVPDRVEHEQLGLEDQLSTDHAFWYAVDDIANGYQAGTFALGARTLRHVMDVLRTGVVE
jgi:hypothetical protein